MVEMMVMVVEMTLLEMMMVVEMTLLEMMVKVVEVTLLEMMMMVVKMMAYSLRSSHANQVNPNQCSTSASGTHKRLGNREICNRRKRKIWLFKMEKYASKKVKTATTGRLCSFARAQSSSDNQKQFRLNCNHLKY